MTLVFVVLALGYMRGWLRSRARPTQAVDAWRAAGFSVDADGGCRLGHVRMQTGVGESGIASWKLGDPASGILD